MDVPEAVWSNLGLTYLAHTHVPTLWTKQDIELPQLEWERRDDGSYDCVVPGSGGKDSFYAAHLLKFKYGMHPLTVTWAPHVYTEWGWKNFQSWIHAGFDNELTTPNGRVHRLLTRLAVENLFHPFQPFIFGQTMGTGAPLECARGTLKVTGSTAFKPVVEQAAKSYEDYCSDADIDTSGMRGSVAGLQGLEGAAEV